MPIQGKLRKELTMEAVLEKISPIDVFSYYIQDKTWQINDTFCSPLREDKSPSFIIGNRYGNITFKDFALDEHRGDCFNFVKIMFNLPNLDSVLRKIDSDFQLGLGNGVEGDYKKIVNSFEKPQITKRNTLIQVVTRKFTKDELAYWNTYHQDLEDLRKNNIYSISKLYFNKKIVYMEPNEIRFGYFTGPSHWKIYFPFRDKKRKWAINNTPNIASWGAENLNRQYNSVIAKSKKDYMVVRKIHPYTAGIQKEGLDAFSEEFIENIKNNSKCVYYGGDADGPGKKASYAITTALGYKHVNPPDSLLPAIKDFADMAKERGLKAIEDHFKLKGIIN